MVLTDKDDRIKRTMLNKIEAGSFKESILTKEERIVYFKDMFKGIRPITSGLIYPRIESFK